MIRFICWPWRADRRQKCRKQRATRLASTLADEPDDIIRGSALIEANLPDIVGRQRIATYIGFNDEDPLESAITAAKLRHELRHAEQRLSPRGDELFALDEFAEQIIQWKVGGLPGGTNLYNLKPIEADANAAAAIFLRDHYGDQVSEILAGDDAALTRSNTPPGNLDDLPAKTVAFIFSFERSWRILLEAGYFGLRSGLRLCPQQQWTTGEHYPVEGLASPYKTFARIGR